MDKIEENVETQTPERQKDEGKSGLDPVVSDLGASRPEMAGSPSAVSAFTQASSWENIHARPSNLSTMFQGAGRGLYGKSPQLNKRLSVTSIDSDLTFTRVVQEEFACIRAKREGLDSAGVKLGTSFALAFSGGGIRAAAFQAGVLWRLAESGLLKDVDYFAAVSGGAYIASSFFSHLYGMPLPEQIDGNGKEAAEQIRSHYLAVVAKAICRMQRNAGNFVRDPWASGESEGSGYLSRVCDLPMLIGLLLMTIAVNPLQITVVYLVPMIEMVELFFGHALRAGLCAPDFWLDLLLDSSPFAYGLWMLLFLIPLTFLMYVTAALKRCRKGENDTTSIMFLLIHGLKHFLMRSSVTLLGFLVLILLLGFTENIAVDNHKRLSHCQSYIRSQGASQSNCGDLWSDRWYLRECYLETTKFNFSKYCPNMDACTGPREIFVWQRNHCCAQSGCKIQSPLPGDEKIRLPSKDGRRLQNVMSYNSVQSPLKRMNSWLPINVESVFEILFTAFLCLLVAAFILTPFMPGLGTKVVLVLIPMVYLILSLVFAQYRIFGVVTGTAPGNMGFDSEKYDRWVVFCLFAQVVVVLFYNETQRVWHKYYARCLSKGFFYKGKDVPLGCLIPSAPGEAEVFPCPFLLYTGTANDFKPNYSAKSITEISLSPLHTGSKRAGYTHTPNFRTLAKATALTGAGCLDAISLSMTKLLKLRVLLQVLNLSWGDFILFNVKMPQLLEDAVYKVPRRWRGVVVSKLYEAPISILWISIDILLYIALHFARQDGDKSCRVAKRLMQIVVGLGIALFAASFFTFLGPLRLLLVSPVIRQFHQFSGFHIRGWEPPGMLYITDGGVQDCTAIVQLVMRRCEHILLVLAAADPQDKLAVLRTAMRFVVENKMGSWYDPQDPRQDPEITLEEFASDPIRTTLRLDILYGWGANQFVAAAMSKHCMTMGRLSANAGSEVEIGHLIIVKNRLPEDSRLNEVPCPPLLTEEEIRGIAKPGEGAADEPRWKSMRATDLGGLGCCDCCHTRCRCNVGGKFPHLTFANYLWLTPHLFSSLARLGYESSGEACEQLLEVCRPDFGAGGDSTFRPTSEVTQDPMKASL